MNTVPDIESSQASSHSSALRKMERHIDELPLLPQVLVRILQLNRDADDYFEQFEKLAKEDPAFAVRIVALANSAASAPVVPICTIRDALSRMGATTVNGLVASLSVQRVFMPREPSQVQLWCHAIETAVTAQCLAGLVPGLKIDPSQAYLIGLLHDIGRFVMLEHAAPELLRVEESDWHTPEELVQADIEVYNYTHSELGYLACQHWGLPDRIAEVVRVHHEPLAAVITPGSVAATQSCIQIADRISIALLRGSGCTELSNDEIEEILLKYCLRTDAERAFYRSSAISQAMAEIRTDSAQLIAGLGFA